MRQSLIFVALCEVIIIFGKKSFINAKKKHMEIPGVKLKRSGISRGVQR